MISAYSRGLVRTQADQQWDGGKEKEKIGLKLTVRRMCQACYEEEIAAIDDEFDYYIHMSEKRMGKLRTARYARFPFQSFF